MDALSSTPSKLASAFNVPVDPNVAPTKAIEAHKDVPTSPTQKTAPSAPTPTTPSTTPVHFDSTDNVATPSKANPLPTSEPKTEMEDFESPTENANTASVLGNDATHPLETPESRIEVEQHQDDTPKAPALNAQEPDFGEFGDTSFFAVKPDNSARNELDMAPLDPNTGSDGFGDWEEDRFSEPKISNASSSLPSISTDASPGPLADTAPLSLEFVEEAAIEHDQTPESAGLPEPSSTQVLPVILGANELAVGESTLSSELHFVESKTTDLVGDEESVVVVSGLDEVSTSTTIAPAIVDNPFENPWNEDEEDLWATKDTDLKLGTETLPSTGESASLEPTVLESNITVVDELKFEEEIAGDVIQGENVAIAEDAPHSPSVDLEMTKNDDSVSGSKDPEPDWNDDENGWNDETSPSSPSIPPAEVPSPTQPSSDMAIASIEANAAPTTGPTDAVQDQPATAAPSSESPSIRHLQSKLDVLTRILDEREKQLTNRSSVMADLQNENEKLKSELEAFKSAQQRMKSSNQGGNNMIEALQMEFSERISTMETKYRTTVKEKDKLAEQLKSTTKQLEGKTSQLEAMKSEMEALGVFDASKASSSSISSQTNSSIVDSAFSSLSSMLLSPQPQSASLPLSTPSSQPIAPTASISSTTSSVISELSLSPQPPTEVSRKIDFSSSSPSPSLSSKLEGLDNFSLEEKVKRYEGALRELLMRDKARASEKSSTDQQLRSLELELATLKKEKESSDKELLSLRESERRFKVAHDSQKDVLSQKISHLESKKTECESLDREVASLKAELDSSWRLNDSLKKEVDSVKLEGEERLKELESKMRSQNADALSALGAKSMQQQLALQSTISELRSALDGSSRSKGTQEEALEVRIAELERAQLVSDQLLAGARQSAELAQTPLLKQISDLQLQLTHQQRALEAAEEAWKARAQTLESALASASHDLSIAQSQLRIAEQTQHKQQQQYARLEHAHQTLQIEHEHLTVDITTAETERQQLQITIDTAQTQLGTLNTKIAAQKAERDEMLQQHANTVAKLEGNIQQLQARIAAITTPGTTNTNSGGAASNNTAMDTTQNSLASHLTQSPLPSRSHSPNIFSTPSSHHSVGGMSTPSSAAMLARQAPSNTSQTALESQITLLRAEKTRLEELLADSVQTAEASAQLERSVERLQLERTQLQERLEAALELVADQSERLQYVDEEIAETKQLYKDEIANLVSQLQLAQTKLKDAESHLSLQQRS